MATFESQHRRMPKIAACLKANGLESLDACNEMLLAKGIDCDKIIRGIQPICFDNAVWAYTLGTAIAVKRGLKSAADCAAAIGEGLEAFTIPGSVAEQRKVGLGHGNLGAMLLHEDTHCFAFLAGHESFAAAEYVYKRQVQSSLEDVALGQLQITDSLLLGGEDGAGHGAQALAQVLSLIHI